MKTAEIQLITNPDDPRLFVPTEEVTDFEGIGELLAEMIKICRRENALGLSANQVGLTHRMFVTNLPGDWPRVFVNPDVQGRGFRVPVIEQCLSNPGGQVKRMRHRVVSILALDASGEPKKVESNRGYYRGKRTDLGKLLAIVAQHEMEHLDGIDTRTGERHA